MTTVERMTAVTLSLMFLLACPLAYMHTKYDKAPTAEELAGIWTADYHGKVFSDAKDYRQFESEAVETLTLQTDGTYRQDFDDHAGYEYHGPTSAFQIDLREGYVFVYLKGMRYYPGGMKAAEATLPESEVGLQMEGHGQTAILCFLNQDLGLCFRRHAFK